MVDALRKFNHQRAVYYEAIREQTGRTQDAVTGLVWLGAAALGFGPHVHKDVLITAGLVGGTTYGLSVAQLTKRRIDVWQAGIDALDCAREAVIPLEMDKVDRQALRDALKEMSKSRADLKLARAALAARMNMPGYDKAQHDPIVQPLLAASDEAMKESEKSSLAGYGLLRASRGSELSALVNRISSKVTEVMGNVALGPEAVKSILASLPSYVDIFTPGVLPTTTASAVKSRTPGAADAQGELSFDADLEADARKLLAVLQELARLQSEVNDRVGNVDVPAARTAMKQCTVATVIKPLELEKDLLTLTRGTPGQYFVEIKGGIPRYEASWLGAWPGGLSVAVDRGVLVITATDQVAVPEARVRVSDSSNPPLDRPLPIKVMPAAPKASDDPNAKSKKAKDGKSDKDKPQGAKKPEVKIDKIGVNPKKVENLAPNAKPAGAAAGEAKPGDSTSVERAWQDLRKNLPNGFSSTLNGVTFTVQSTQAKAGKLFVRLTCSNPSAGLPVAEVRKALAAAAPAATQTLQQNDAMDKLLTQIDVKGSLPCVKE